MDKNDKKIVFYGRPDGLGNRYEELLLLSNYAVENNLYFKYYWNNTGNWKYSNKFTARNIEIIDIDYVKKWPTNNFESTKHWREFISTKDIQYSKNVTLNLNIPAIQKKYIGVLVRGSDRIVDNIELLPPGFQSSEDVERSIKLTEEYLTTSKKKLPLVLFSEDSELKQYVSNKLIKFDQILLPQISSMEQAYQDFINLIAAEEIILCSKFSSFALSAGLISNKKVVKFHPYSHPLLKRWKNEFINFPTEEQSSIIDKLNLPVYGNEVKTVSVGNKFIKSYLLPSEVLEKVSILSSYNKSKYIGFEEHLKLLKKSVNIKMINLSIFLQDFKKVVDILKLGKNRKTLINEQLRLAKKSLDLIGYKSYFLKFRPLKSYKNFYFIFINIEDLVSDLSFFLRDAHLIGAVVAFSNFESEKILINDLLHSTDDFKFHVNLYEDNNNSSGYISFSKKGI
jgi:hypothetical protein